MILSSLNQASCLNILSRERNKPNLIKAQYPKITSPFGMRGGSVDVQILPKSDFKSSSKKSRSRKPNNCM
jgi:hypothetical protein